MPEAKNSGRVMIDQTISQTWISPISAQFRTPTPSPTSSISATEATASGRSISVRVSDTVTTSASTTTVTMIPVSAFRMNRASSASSQVTVG